MNVLFVGNHPPKSLIESTNGRINSFYRSSEAMIDGFRKRDDIIIDVITSPDIPSYPKERMFFKKVYSETDNVLMVSSLNVPVIKHLWTSIALFFAARRIIKGRKEITYVIIPYMVFRHVIALRLIHLFCKRTRVGLIIPDVFFHKSIIDRFLNHISEKLAQKSDFFILYTDSMASYLGIEDKPYITIEGFKIIPPLSYSSYNPIVMYTGSLDLKYGIGRLVDMMKYIPNNELELHIYGSGDAEEIIKTASNKDKRIKFFGKVKKEDADKAIKNAMALVNPRNSEDGDFVNYSFPSKDIDYLASGVPAILCRLPGMPSSYFDYFIDAGKGSPKELADAVIHVSCMTHEERLSFTKKAYGFISERMDVSKQVNQIVQLFSKV